MSENSKYHCYECEYAKAMDFALSAAESLRVMYGSQMSDEEFALSILEVVEVIIHRASMEEALEIISGSGIVNDETFKSLEGLIRSHCDESERFSEIG